MIQFNEIIMLNSTDFIRLFYGPLSSQVSETIQRQGGRAFVDRPESEKFKKDVETLRSSSIQPDEFKVLQQLAEYNYAPPSLGLKNVFKYVIGAGTATVPAFGETPILATIFSLLPNSSLNKLPTDYAPNDFTDVDDYIKRALWPKLLLTSNSQPKKGSISGAQSLYHKDASIKPVNPSFYIAQALSNSRQVINSSDLAKLISESMNKLAKEVGLNIDDSNRPQALAQVLARTAIHLSISLNNPRLLAQSIIKMKEAASRILGEEEKPSSKPTFKSRLKIVPLD